MTGMVRALVLFAGGGLGALARFFISGFLMRKMHLAFPAGTLVVNATGSFAIGLILPFAGAALLPDSWKLFAVTGFLGAYTTFSAFAFETASLAYDRSYKAAFWNFVLNNGLAFLAVAAGMGVSYFILARVRSLP